MQGAADPAIARGREKKSWRERERERGEGEVKVHLKKVKFTELKELN